MDISFDEAAFGCEKEISLTVMEAELHVEEAVPNRGVLLRHANTVMVQDRFRLNRVPRLVQFVNIKTCDVCMEKDKI
jgi:hypothetical protein